MRECEDRRLASTRRGTPWRVWPHRRHQKSRRKASAAAGFCDYTWIYYIARVPFSARRVGKANQKYRAAVAQIIALLSIAVIALSSVNAARELKTQRSKPVTGGLAWRMQSTLPSNASPPVPGRCEPSFQGAVCLADKSSAAPH